MNDEHAAGLKAVVRLAMAGDVNITLEDGIEGDLRILVDWPSHNPSSTSVSICLLEDTVQSYTQCSASVRACAQIRLFKYLRDQLKAQSEPPEYSSPKDSTPLTWTVLYPHLFGSFAKEPRLPCGEKRTSIQRRQG